MMKCGVVKVYDDHKAEPDELVEKDNVTTGEVIISSPGKTTYSYYNNPEEEANKFYKGWMYTGDLGTWGENLYVTINGRKDDMIVCSGENIYPTQIEEALNEMEKVQDSMVVAVPDKVRGQAVAAYVVAKDPSLTIAELTRFCNNSPMLSTYKRPRWYCIVEELPHTATGKKMHYVMKQQAAEDLKNGVLREDNQKQYKKQSWIKLSDIYPNTGARYWGIYQNYPTLFFYLLQMFFHDLQKQFRCRIKQRFFPGNGACDGIALIVDRRYLYSCLWKG